ncbi:NAD-binding protein [Arsenicicoccus dermatophilus]|uniref:NAD-binding protein n=1 Tax=Arsenicicoccus dermatophilus TaxID=1076331 RepID=UPI0039170B94
MATEAEGGRGRHRVGHVLVVGVETTTIRVADELVRGGTPVVVVGTPAADRDLVAELRGLAGVELLEVPRVRDAVLQEADASHARAVVVLGRDEVEVTRVALAVAESTPAARLVLEVVNDDFGNRLEELLQDCETVCPAVVAAPTFVAAARGELERRPVAGRDVVVSPDELLRRSGEKLVPVRLSPEQQAAPGTTHEQDRLLPSAEATPGTARVAMGFRSTGRRRRVRTRGLLGGWRHLVDRRQRIVLALLALVIVASTVYFHHDAQKDWLTAAYLAVTMATGTGYGDPDDADLRVKVTAVVFQSLGLLLASGLTAVLTDALTGSRLQAITGGVRGHPRRHVVVCGLGRIGTQVVVLLRAEGIAVVAVERNEEAYGVNRIRRLKVPVIIGHASDPSTLEAAGIRDCDTVMALTDDDAVNLEIALVARSARDDLRLVTRLFDDELARRVQHRLAPGVSLSVSMLCAPRIVARALGRPIPQVPVAVRAEPAALLAELLVEPGSEIVACLPAQLDIPGHVRVLAVRRRAGEDAPAPAWTWPPTAAPLAPGDAIAVAATAASHDRLARSCRRARSGASVASGGSGPVAG